MNCKYEYKGQQYKSVYDARKEIMMSDEYSELDNIIFYSSRTEDIIQSLKIYRDNLQKKPNKTYATVTKVVNENQTFPTLSEKEKIVQDLGMKLGTAIHAVLQGLDVDDNGKSNIIFDKNIKEIKDLLKTYNDETLQYIYEKLPLLKHSNFEDIIKNDEDNNVISVIKKLDLFKNFNDLEILTEFSFVLNESELSPEFYNTFKQENGQEFQGLTGTIDAIVINKKTGEIFVIDYKTHKFGIQNANIPTYTKLQLTYYQYILAKILNIPANKVKAFVVDINQFENNLQAEQKSLIVNSQYDQNTINRIASYINSPMIFRVEDKNYLFNNREIIKKIYPERLEKTLDIETFKELVKEKAKSNHFLKCYFEDNYQIIDVDGNKLIIKHQKSGVTKRIDINSEIEKRLESRKGYLNSIIEVLNQYNDSPEEAIENLKTLGKNIRDVEKRVILNLKKYVMDNKWQYVPHPGLEANNCILMMNVITKEFDVISLVNSENMSQKLKMKIGTTIFGDIIPDIELQKRGIIDNLITNSLENIEIFKIILLLNEYAEQFNGDLKIGNIKLLNLKSGSVSLPKNLDQFKLMLQYYKSLRSDDIKLSSKLSFSPLINQIQYYVYDLLKVNNLTFSQTDFDQLTTTDQIINKLKEIKDYIQHQYSQQLLNENSDIWELDKQLSMLITLYQDFNYTDINKPDEKGIRFCNIFRPVYDSLRYGRIADTNAAGFTISGLAQGSITALAFNNPDNIIDQFEKIIGAAFINLRKQLDVQGNEVNNITKKLLEQKSTAYKLLVGDNRDLYIKFLKKNSDGKIDPVMRFINPYNNEKNALDNDTELEFLEIILWNINRFRIPTGERESQLSEKTKALTYEQLKQNSSEFQKYKNIVSKSTDLRYLDYPLRRTRNGKLLKAKFANSSSIKEFWDMCKNGLMYEINPLNLTEGEQKRRDEMVDTFEMFDRYDDSQSTRQELLEKYSPEYFELNINAVVYDYIFSKLRKQIYDDVLEKADCIIGTLQFLQATTDRNFDDTIKTLRDRIKVTLYSSSLVGDDMMNVVQTGGIIKSINALIKMGFRGTLFIKEMSVGVTKLMAKAASGYFNEGKLNAKYLALGLAKSYGVSASDALGKMSGSIDTGDFSKIGLLNKRFGIANLDINIVAEKTQYDRQGFSNITKRLPYALLTAPDFLNRMGVFVGSMISEGIYDAYTVNSESNSLVYDMSKDERFKEFWANKNGTSEKIKEQRALYRAMAVQFRKQNIFLNTGENGIWDPLPEAYTDQQVRSINEQINTVLGTFDHELSENLRHMSHYILFRQFNSYISSEIKKYFSTGKNSATGEMVDAKIEVYKDGQLVKEQLYVTGYDENTSKPILKSESELTEEEKQIYDKYKVWEGHPVEGLAISFLKTIHDIFTGKIASKYKSDNWKDKQQIANTKVFLLNTLINMLIGLLLAAVFEEDDDDREQLSYTAAYGKKILEKYRNEFSMIDSIYGPISDLNFISLNVLEDLSSDLLYLSSNGDRELTQYIMNNLENISAIKDFTNLE